MTRRRLADLRHNWIGILGALLFWCLLWGGFSVTDVLGGLLAVVLIYLLFPLPPTSDELTIHPVAFVVFASRFALDLVLGSWQVSRFVLRPGPPPGGSVIAVPLRSRSDVFLTGTAMLATLVPGSVVVEAQRSTSTLFLHVIGAVTTEEVEQSRQAVIAQEERLLRAVGRRSVLEEAGLR